MENGVFRTKIESFPIF